MMKRSYLFMLITILTVSANAEKWPQWTLTSNVFQLGFRITINEQHANAIYFNWPAHRLITKGTAYFSFNTKSGEVRKVVAVKYRVTNEGIVIDFKGAHVSRFQKSEMLITESGEVSRPSDGHIFYLVPLKASIAQVVVPSKKRPQVRYLRTMMIWDEYITFDRTVQMGEFEINAMILEEDEIKSNVRFGRVENDSWVDVASGFTWKFEKSVSNLEVKIASPDQRVFATLSYKDGILRFEDPTNYEIGSFKPKLEVLQTYAAAHSNLPVFYNPIENTADNCVDILSDKK
jgi:hypothetical protein